MPKDYPRSYKVADQIQKDLSQLFRSVKDPRLSPFVTIEEVRVTRDLSVAKIFISTLDDKGEEAEEILNHAAGYLRSELGKRIRMRSIPELRFTYDTVTQEGQRLSTLIDKAVKSDTEQTADDNASDEALPNNSGDQNDAS